MLDASSSFSFTMMLSAQTSSALTLQSFAEVTNSISMSIILDVKEREIKKADMQLQNGIVSKEEHQKLIQSKPSIKHSAKSLKSITFSFRVRRNSEIFVMISLQCFWIRSFFNLIVKKKKILNPSTSIIP